MKKIVFSILLGLSALMPAGESLTANISELQIQTAGIEYGQRRPFSFYYPNNYQYYYPRPEYGTQYDNDYYPSSNQCYWLYTNGTYVYYCG